MLTFTQDGLLTPAQAIETNPDTIQTLFVQAFPMSGTRALLFGNWMKYNAMLRGEVGQDFVQWIDGSFVTQQMNPNDIDIVSFIPDRLFRKFEERLNHYWSDNWEKEGIDAYLVSIVDTDLTKSAVANEWFRLYTRTKPTSRPPLAAKGFLQIQVQ